MPKTSALIAIVSVATAGLYIIYTLAPAAVEPALECIQVTRWIIECTR